MKVLIAQSHLSFAEAVSSVLKNAAVNVVGITTTGRAALEALASTVPDILLLDLRLPDMCGVGVGRRALELQPAVKILALTAVDDPSAAGRALQEGFHGVLPTGASTARLIEALTAISAGQTILPQHVTTALGRKGQPHERECALLVSRLTNRERQVLGLLATGANSKEIARHLKIAPNTVRTHVQRLLAKLGVNNRLKAVVLATTNGLLAVPNSELTSRD